MRALILGLAALFPVASLAIVDMKSANYSDSWTDMIVPGVGYDLRINRTYNSRSLFTGIFGYGWCSDYETTLTVTPENTLRLTECGAGKETLFTAKNYSGGKTDEIIKQILVDVKKRRPDLKEDYLTSLAKDMKTNEYLREEFSRRLNIKGKVSDGVTYFANGREAETIVLKNGQYKRAMPDGTYELFDAANGHMVYMYDKNQNYLKLAWEKDSLSSVADNLGRKLNFKYNPANKKVAVISGPNNLNAVYTTKGEDLVEVVDSKQDSYKYTYDDTHNLTKMDFPDKTYKALTYNKDKDWVTSFRNRKGCVETYEYETSKDDPKNHFWSVVQKKCNDKVTNNSKYEFFHKMRPDGLGVFLARVRTENNGAVTDISYHEIFGKPTSILRDGLKTEYTYFDNGMIKTKKEPGRQMAFEYKNTCNKVSQVVMNFYEEEAKSPRKPSQARAEKLVRSVKTHFDYEVGKCNLKSAQNSEGQTVALQYDDKGRISQIEDQSKKLVTIKYETRFGKPWIVTRPGLGTIQVSYKADGEIQKVDSKEGSTVAVQVAGIFNNLLDIIAPATNETTL